MLVEIEGLQQRS
ncbi:hypothetical protein LINPERPRIM_LOCUS18840 [Linum perenne]